MVYLAPYDLMGWSAVCTCSARASVLYRLFFYRPYRPNEGHRRSQTCRPHVYYRDLWTFVVVLLVECRLHAPGPNHCIREGSSGSRKYWTSDTNFGTLMEFNVCISMVHSGVATGGGGKRGNLPPPPQPPIGHPVRSMQIREDFHVGKKWG